MQYAGESPVGIEIGYLAGMIDGEGSIGFHGRGTPYVSIYNTSLPLMKWLMHRIGGSFDGHDKRGRVQSYAWRIQAVNDVLTLLYVVKNHLIIKKEKASKVIKILEDRYGKSNQY